MHRIESYGTNSDVDIAAQEDVWSEGGDYPFPSATAATTIESADAADDGSPAGTGARTARVVGLNSNLDEIQEDVVLNGTSAVTLVNQFFRVNSVQVLTVGSGFVNAGKISVKHSSTVIAAIPIGANRSNAAVYTAGRKTKCHKVRRVNAGISNAVAGTAAFYVMTRKSGGSFQIRSVFTAHGTGQTHVEHMMDLLLDEGEDLKVRAAVSADNTAVAASFLVYAGSVEQVTKS